MNTYVAAVRERLGEQATPDVLAVAEALEQHADRTGVLASMPRPPVDKQAANEAARALRGARLFVPPRDGRPGRIVIPAPAPAAPRRSHNPPRSGAETREPRDQNEHTLALINYPGITKHAQHLAMVANVEIAISAARQGVPFGKAERELTPEYLARKTGWSERKAGEAMAEAVRLGFFRRTDNGRGGRGGAGRATYRATLPGFLDS